MRINWIHATRLVIQLYTLTVTRFSGERFACVARLRLAGFVHGYYAEQVLVTLNEAVHQAFRGGRLDFQSLFPHRAVLVLLLDDVPGDG